MKKIALFIVGVVAAFATSCTQYQEVTEFEPITLGKEEYSVEGYTDKQFNVSLMALGKVEITTDCDWMSTPREYINPGVVGQFNVSCTANNTIDERVGTITLTTTDTGHKISYSKTITVTQGRGESRIEVYANEEEKDNFISVGSDKGTARFYLKSNIDYNIKTDSDWIHLSSQSGKGNPDKEVEIVFYYDANNIQWSRAGSIDICDTSGSTMASVIVEQDAFKVYWKVVPEGDKELSIESYDSVINKIRIYTNVSWEATCNADWITLKNPSYTYTGNPHYSLSATWVDLEFTAEFSYIDRWTTIEITNSFGVKSVVVVSQSGAPMLDICNKYVVKKGYQAKYLAEEHSVKIFSQLDWVATSSNPEWLTITTLEGGIASEQQDFTFKVAENFTGLTREATITIEPKDKHNYINDYSVTMKVIQDHQYTLYYTGGIFYEDGGTIFDSPIKDHIVIDEESNRKKLIFEDAVTTIRANDYEQNSWNNGTKDIILPGTITTIGKKAFYGASMLKTVDIPTTITEIGESAFGQCVHLYSVTIRATEPPKGGASMFTMYGSYIPSGLSIYVPTASVDKYKTAQYWSDYADNIKDGGF